jgi:hypothetical protein
MAALTVWKFDSASRAQGALELLDRLQEELIQVDDPAVVTWPVGRKKPKTEQLHGVTGAGALAAAPGLAQARLSNGAASGRAGPGGFPFGRARLYRR